MTTISSLPTSLPTITLLISNMHCTSCCETIHQLLSTIQSVQSISTSLLLHSVTFSVDLENSASSSNGRPKTIGRVTEEALKVLRGEGGFNVIAESSDGSSRSRYLDSLGEDEEIGWIGRLLLQTKRGKERKKLEDRKKKHLEHCKICQDELAGRDIALGQVQEAQSSQGVDPPLENDRIPSIQKNKDDEVSLIKTTLSIEGMTCASCVNSITSSLKSTPGIISVNINLLGSSGIVRHRSSTSPQDVANLIEDIGFEAQVIKSELEGTPLDEEEQGSQSFKSVFSIEGMTCASCTGAITRALQDHEGTESINIDLLNNAGTIVHSSEILTDQIKDIIEEVGYGAELSSSQPLSVSLAKGKEKEEGPELRTVQLKIEGMFCHDCVRKVNSYLDSLTGIETYTPITLQSPITTIAYYPYQPLTIRNLIDGISNVAPEFEVELLKIQSLSERSKKIQKKEVILLAGHCAIAIVFAIPTFIIAIVSMILLPDHDPFKMRMMAPVWGAANLGTVILWPLASVVQFGVGRIFYKRAFASIWPHLRRLVPSALRTKSMRRLPPRPLGWKTLISFGSMDLLVVLSTTVSYFASLAMLILDVRASPGTESVGTYFDSCVFLIMFILLGRTLEAFAKSRTTDAVSLLGKMRPDTALLVETLPTSDDTEVHNDLERKKSQDTTSTSTPESENTSVSQNITRTIPVGHLEIGDTILLPPGSLPPTDGIIVSGQTTFDESSLTGESLPIKKSIDDQVFTGTVNLSSAITMKVTDLAENTMLEKIIRAVSDASARKAPLELMAEKLTGYFVPVIVYFSLLVLAIWLILALTHTVDNQDEGKAGGRVFFALEFAIATLVVACPCGIGLAVPCANAVGNGIAAKNGILASGGGEAFLAATRIRRIAFDKTGTLTIGKSVVTDEEWMIRDEKEKEWVKRATKEVERGSTHPLAVGLVEYLEKEQAAYESNTLDDEKQNKISINHVEVLETKEIAGRGLKAIVKIDNQTINLLIGNVAQLMDHNVVLDSTHQELVEKWSNQAKSIVAIASQLASEERYKLSAIFSLSDPPRETSADLIKSLKERGIQVSMLSGDNQSTALAVSRMLGLEEGEVKGGVGPEGKAEVIRGMQRDLKEGESGDGKGLVMFVGDGLNDSVALAAADVSCAMGHGSQATLASADFVLLSSSLPSILTLIHISKKIILRQKLNLLWALLFNVVCLPFAAGVFYGIHGIRLTPVWSAVLMALSSVSVVGSSLAMRWGL